MLIGEYPFEDEWTEGWLQKIWYILYTFLLFLVSLNILLAIIVESFLRVKQETEGRLEVKSLVVDLLSLPVLASSPRAPKDRAADLLRYYHWLLGNVVLDEKGREYEARAFSLNFDMRSFLRSAFRRRIAKRKVEKLRKLPVLDQGMEEFVDTMYGLRQRPIDQSFHAHVPGTGWTGKELASTQLDPGREDLRNSPGNVIWSRDCKQVMQGQVSPSLICRTAGRRIYGSADTDENTWTGLVTAEDEGSGSGIAKR
ncbi:hypothetical protein AK812_SmicGene32207 [Symbiodinium microadriaticum]|uniref:Uncharacterized protein n=1 Tax=Symbiodinium microadriaticum TaxID=2951 RepID=A0A1Q9CUP5_SYMMI|nr:hypothetical protein AK812_SmicGene32207 [Symbiodinium microadriaticum]